MKIRQLISDLESLKKKLTPACDDLLMKINKRDLASSEALKEFIKIMDAIINKTEAINQHIKNQGSRDRTSEIYAILNEIKKQLGRLHAILDSTEKKQYVLAQRKNKTQFFYHDKSIGFIPRLILDFNNAMAKFLNFSNGPAAESKNKSKFTPFHFWNYQEITDPRYPENINFLLFIMRTIKKFRLTILDIIENEDNTEPLLQARTQMVFTTERFWNYITEYSQYINTSPNITAEEIENIESIVNNALEPIRAELEMLLTSFNLIWKEPTDKQADFIKRLEEDINEMLHGNGTSVLGLDKIYSRFQETCKNKKEAIQRELRPSGTEFKA